jgi:hypothetical protein
MNKSEVIAELQRVAKLADTQSVSRSTFQKHADLSTSAVEQTFGSWNEAIIAAGLIPLSPGGTPRSEKRRLERVGNSASAPLHDGRIADEELLNDLVRLAKELGRRPSINHVAAKGNYSPSVYQRRWGSIAKAFQLATADRSV